MLFATMPVARAHEMLHDPEIGGSLDAEQLYDLCTEAGYSPEASSKAASQRALDRLRKNLPP